MQIFNSPLHIEIISKDLNVTVETLQALADKLGVSIQQCKIVINTDLCTFSVCNGYKPIFCVEIDSPLYQSTPFVPINISTVLSDTFDINTLKVIQDS